MAGLEGFRVLVVEDEPILALELKDLLSDLGCEVAGAAGRIAEALQLARTLDFDVAILDVNLGGVRVDPVADVLDERGLPYVFATGYASVRTGRPSKWPVIEKPFEGSCLLRAITTALGRKHA